MDDNTFVVAVRGNGMKNAGLSDGDLVRCVRAESAKDGDIVYAFIKNRNCIDWWTLARYREEDGAIHLYSETDEPSYAPFIRVSARYLKIFGIFQNVVKWH